MSLRYQSGIHMGEVNREGYEAARRKINLSKSANKRGRQHYIQVPVPKWIYQGPTVRQFIGACWLGLFIAVLVMEDEKRVGAGMLLGFVVGCLLMYRWEDR